MVTISNQSKNIQMKKKRDTKLYKRYPLLMLRSEMNSYQQYAAAKDMSFKEFIRKAINEFIRNEALQYPKIAESIMDGSSNNYKKIYHDNSNK